MQTAVSFLVGVLSSLAATGVLVLHYRSRYRLRFQSVLRLIEQLGDSIRRDGFQFDCLLAIGRNSGVAGSILIGHFGLSAIVSVSTIKGRLQDGTRTIEFDDVSKSVLPAIAGKRVLVLICCNDSGATLGYVTTTLRALPVPPIEIRTAAVYTSPSPSFMPQYRAVTLERDASHSMTAVLNGLPWISPSWLHPLRNERHGSNSLTK